MLLILGLKFIAPSEQTFNQLHPDVTDKKEKPKINLSCIVDNSGSMSGEPMQLVRNTLEFVISKMRDSDSLGIVQFSSWAKTLADMTCIDTQETREGLTKIANKIFADGFDTLLFFLLIQNH